MSEAWEMPQWMKPYTGLIVKGETISYVEEMVNDQTAVQINTPRALMAVEIGGRVQMLTWLYNKGLLNEYGYDPDRIC